VKFLLEQSKSGPFKEDGLEPPAPCEGAVFERWNEWDDAIWSIEIDSLEQLLALSESLDTPLIVSKLAQWELEIIRAEGLTHSIEIYNDYRE
jgi:hypothetical protein